MMIPKVGFFFFQVIDILVSLLSGRLYDIMVFVFCLLVSWEDWYG